MIHKISLNVGTNLSRVENNRHFLFDCPLYALERDTMYKQLQNINFLITLNNVLFGNKELNNDCNINAFQVIQNYIKFTKRFD